jgi:dienelactone hydrolase
MPKPCFEEFHTSEIILKRRFRLKSRQMAFTGGSPPRVRAWQAKARRLFAKLLGLPNFTACQPRTKQLASVKVGDLVREEWLIQTEPDVWMPFYIFLPPLTDQGKIRKPLPAVLCLHGHRSAGKWATGGVPASPEMSEIIRNYDYDYGLQIARAGCITVCPDARGFGQRREPMTQSAGGWLDGSCHQLTLSGAPLGLTVQGMWTWDLMRLIDWLVSDQRIDRNRIGAAGLSGGGLQTLNLLALDRRVKAGVVSGYFYGVRESLQVKNNNCMCNLVPRLWENFDMGDIGALAAPRGLFIETGDEDELNGASKLANVRSQVAIARKVYQAVKRPDQLRHFVFHGGHKWNGRRSIPWMLQQLGADKS